MIKKLIKFLDFLEQERIKCMIHSGWVNFKVLDKL